MDVVESFKGRLQNRSNLVFIKLLLCDLHDIGDTATNAVFHHNPQVIIFEKGTVISDDVVIIAFFKNPDLSGSKITSFLIDAIYSPEVAGSTLIA